MIYEAGICVYNIFLTKIFFKNQKSLKQTFDTSFEFKITLLFFSYYII